MSESERDNHDWARAAALNYISDRVNESRRVETVDQMQARIRELDAKLSSAERIRLILEGDLEDARARIAELEAERDKWAQLAAERHTELARWLEERQGFRIRIRELEAENAKLLAAIESWKKEEALNIEIETEFQQRIRELEAALEVSRAVGKRLLVAERDHDLEMIRNLAGQLAQPEAERIAKLEAALCEGDYCDDGCQKWVGA